jgi:transcription initiation factor TFIIE subunit alpha
MIDDPLVKKLLSKIVEKDHEEQLKKRYKEMYTGEAPEGIDNLIRALQLPPEDIQFIADDIKETVEEIIIPIIKALIDGIETDEEIAEKTGIKLNIVRKILYKLYDMGLANYKRSKDPETQWFTYSWKFDSEEIVNIINKESNDELKMLNDELEREENNMFFVCPHGHVRLDFNEATDLYYEFSCPACGEELEFQDNTSTIKQIKDEIKIVEKNLDSFNKKVKQ